MASFFEAPIPGQSLTDEPKNWPWENPPEMVDPDEAAKYYINRLANEDVMDDLSVLFDNDMPVAPFVKTLLTTGVMNGLHSVDVSIIIAPVIHEFIKASMTTYGIDVRDDIEDPEEQIKERERNRLSLAIELAVANAKGKEGDIGLDLLKTIEGTLNEPDDDVPQEEEMEVSEMAEPQGLMARGA
tara:strand:+ start:46 stop:600 length:555 start_codon:yes stop_codon:yes gene_type:complete